METSNRYKLIQGIIELSDAKTWDEAKLEWDLVEIYHQEEPDTCLCGHDPIIEICVLENRQNKNSTIVGNVCVKKFLGLPSDQIFQAVRRIGKDAAKALNAEAIQHAYNRNWIDKWKRDFYFDTLRKRNLSEKQLSKRIEINRLVLANINRNRDKKG
jgi:hypothetical protein